MRFLWLHFCSELLSGICIPKALSHGNSSWFYRVVRSDSSNQLVSRDPQSRIAPVFPLPTFDPSVLLMILHEITQHNFETADCSSLEEYFSLCDRYSLDYYRGLNVKGGFFLSFRKESVKRKPIEVRVASMFRASHVSGNSETFYGNALSHSATPIVENDAQRSPDFSPFHSISPGSDLRIEWQENTDSCMQMYRRMSGYMGSMQEAEEPVKVVDCASTGTSFCGTSDLEEIVGEEEWCEVGYVLWGLCDERGELAEV